MLAHFSLVLTLVSLALAALTPRFKKEQMLFVDYSPAIVSPSGGESWAAGSVQSVSWNQTALSGNNTPEAQTASIWLGYKSTNASDTNEHLYYELLSDIPLYAPAPGTANFTLPANLVTRSTYILALIGSSGDVSKEFTITSTPAAMISIRRLAKDSAL